MITSSELGQQAGIALCQLHQTVYPNGTRGDIADVFGGGNAGAAMVAIAMMEIASAIRTHATAMERVAKAIEHLPAPLSEKQIKSLTTEP